MTIPAVHTCQPQIFYSGTIEERRVWTNVFGPTARPACRPGSHACMRRGKRNAVPSRHLPIQLPMLQWGCCGPRPAQLTRSQRLQHRRRTTGHAQTPNVGSPGPPLAGKAPRASPQGVSPNLPNCQISLDQRSSDGKTPTATPLDAFRQLSCGPNSLPPARTPQSSLELS